MKNVMLLAFVCLYAFSGMAQMQPGTINQSTLDVGIKSPDVASMGKFGNVPVGPATGVPSISIPFTEIKVGQITLPLSFAYHAGGIRVSETSSSTGLGWSMGFPVVSRSMVGRPDEDANSGMFKMPPADSVAFFPYLYPEYIFGVQLGNADNEPDLFSYSLNGYSGAFSFRRNKSIIQTPLSNNKIEYKSVPFLGDIFQVTDDKGIVYIFGHKVSTDLAIMSGYSSYTSAWRLTKMVDPNSMDTIFFSYETACNPMYQKNISVNHFLGQDKQCNVNITESFLSEAKTTVQTVMVNESYPKEISWRGGKVVFTNSCDRADVSGSAMRLREANLYSNVNGTLKLVKRAVLYQSYFYSTGSEYAFANAPEDQKKRLRLDSLAIFPNSGSLPPMVYRMAYDTSRMAPRESAAQDRWGFNNGKFTNYSMMAAQNVLWNNQYYAIGSANRTVDSAAMRACMLTSLQYPLKGKTVFNFGPHAFYGYEMQTELHSASLNCDGSTSATDTVLITVAANDVRFKYSFWLPGFTSGQVTDRPRIDIKDLTTGLLYGTTSIPVGHETEDFSLTNMELQLVAGHTYQITMNVFSSSPDITGHAYIEWTKNLGNLYVRKIGGGLKANVISDYDEYGRFVSGEKYEYVGGTMLTDLYYQDMNFEHVIPRATQGEGINCRYQTQQYPPGFSLIFHSNGLLPASQYSGSPVLYKNVTKYQVDSLGNPNGKTEYGFNIMPDYSAALQDMGHYGELTWNVRGPVMQLNSWKNNFPAFVNVYKSVPGGGYKKVNSKVYDYRESRITKDPRVKIRPRFLTVCCLSNNISSGYAAQDFYRTLYDLSTGAMLLMEESDTTWDNQGNKMYTSKEYRYSDSTHLYPTVVRTANSSGDTVLAYTKYVNDFVAAGNVYDKMRSRNMIGLPVQSVVKKNGVQLSETTVNYVDWFGNSKLLLPASVDEKVAAYPVERRVTFNSYDVYGNILEQQEDSAIKLSYIWGYDTVSPIAAVKNAAQNEVAHTSFEPDASGNWTIASATRDLTQGITGKQSYLLSNGSVSRSGLTASKAYVVSYWSKSTTATVNGTTAVSYYSKNGWNYFEHSISAGTATVTVSGSVTIDELRVYPKDAQMVTCTYEALTGKSSECDENNRITYYEFDPFNRLKGLRDANKFYMNTHDYRIKL